MKLFEVKIDATDDSDENSEKISQIIYSLVDTIGSLEEEGRIFRVIIEDVDPETIEYPNKYLH